MMIVTRDEPTNSLAEISTHSSCPLLTASDAKSDARKGRRKSKERQNKFATPVWLGTLAIASPRSPEERPSYLNKHQLTHYSFRKPFDVKVRKESVAAALSRNNAEETQKEEKELLKQRKRKEKKQKKSKKSSSKKKSKKNRTDKTRLHQSAPELRRSSSSGINTPATTSDNEILNYDSQPEMNFGNREARILRPGTPTNGSKSCPVTPRSDYGYYSNNDTDDEGYTNLVSNGSVKKHIRRALIKQQQQQQQQNINNNRDTKYTNNDDDNGDDDNDIQSNKTNLATHRRRLSRLGNIPFPPTPPSTGRKTVSVTKQKSPKKSTQSPSKKQLSPSATNNKPNASIVDAILPPPIATPMVVTPDGFPVVGHVNGKTSSVEKKLRNTKPCDEGKISHWDFQASEGSLSLNDLSYVTIQNFMDDDDDEYEEYELDSDRDE